MKENNSRGNGRPNSSTETTIFEEDVPVIVRRRGCLLRVRITSITDDDLDQYEKAYVGFFLLPFFVFSDL